MLALHRRQIGTVFQDHQLLNDRSVYDNVALPLEISGLDPREGKRRVRAALDKVGLLSKEKLLPMALSGGEQQRVGIARAVVNTPRIILADEPTWQPRPRTIGRDHGAVRAVYERGRELTCRKSRSRVNRRPWLPYPNPRRRPA